MAEIETDDELQRRKFEEALEVKSLRRIISAYLNYPEAAEEDVKRWERSLTKLPPHHKALLSHLPLKFQKLRWCIAQNSYFIFEMLKVFEPPLDMSQDVDICENQHLDDVSGCHHFSRSRNLCSCESSSISGGVDRHCLAEPSSTETCNGKCLAPTKFNEVSSSPPDWLDPSLQLHVPLVDVDKVRCIIRNIVRDWANEVDMVLYWFILYCQGQKERDQCYRPILEELKRLFPNRSKENTPACLVPGAGLGRLALEISCLGFASQGNEFSYYMMICSSFILNHTQAAGEWTIFPWIHSNCNSVSDNDQLRPVSIPDIHPASAGITEGFSMCGGDFVEVYSDPSQAGVWDAVVTCFFLDTAHNIVEYIEIISKVLKDGGVWINLGPLLYHFADMYSPEDEMSIDLSLEDVKRVALHYGFIFEKESTIETTYTTNPRSMMQNRYYAAFWTMRKKTMATL
ncbi:hypothetical protein HAX54_030777 [Datura stramonium]|uniref:carnosine N-methyltransferase n=1 Tax=Datura stramonium TaxID=4076 RepID=A0ABS8SBF0_DATST|nr:hypothetical protein [Datura stramonium]